MKKNIDYKKTILDFAFLMVGCILLAFAITSILKPNGLVSGGITGISIILDKLIGIKYTYLYYTLSILIFISAWLALGRREGKKIILLSIIFPLVLIALETLDLSLIKNDTMLASIYYGIIGGIGCGLVLKRGFSTGGTDTIAKILHYRMAPFISISQILLCIDVVIIIASAFVYDENIALYAVLAQIVMMKSIDIVLFGFGSRYVKIEVISDKSNDIADYIIKNIRRGISTYEIKGGYTNISREKVVSICSPRESMLIKRYISQVDPLAFVNVLPVMSVWGNGIGFDSVMEENNG
ncbi:YitT family protein [Alkaliphilus serpentinus]|uniref:YitT family protein n=1 Tax=Alkaliphilus serpentinus TaxID=1482731 RepID=A0A833HLA2_9FIRM|nr:YitT family protein [Alkaliphilus serpentinus]KAB3525591.1 YitT family protein [Alkaliphilus serpentinus]